LIAEDAFRTTLGEAALEQATSYTWDHATQSFAAIIEAAISGRAHLDEVDPE